MKKIIAVASAGGHWTQMQRLKTAFEDVEVIYVSTLSGYTKELNGEKFYKVTDASQWSKLKLIKLCFELIKIIRNEKPNAIISTGAAPGAFAILIGKLMGIKTIWVDSIANFEKLSLSGKLVKNITDLHITQWEHLKTEKTVFKGKVL
jgi:UDP-N-acetylglucosamine:LPS N-acetylglucosamine transferase